MQITSGCINIPFVIDHRTRVSCWFVCRFSCNRARSHNRAALLLWMTRRCSHLGSLPKAPLRVRL